MVTGILHRKSPPSFTKAWAPGRVKSLWGWRVQGRYTLQAAQAWDSCAWNHEDLEIFHGLQNKPSWGYNMIYGGIMQRSTLMKTHGEACNAVAFFPQAHNHSRSFVISRYVAGSRPSWFARLFSSECQCFQRNIPHVCKCKRRSASVTSRTCASAREDLLA